MHSHSAEILPVLVFADDVSKAVQCGARVLVDRDLLVRFHWFAMT